MTINSINKNQEALNTPLNENTEEYYKLKYNKKLILYYISNKFYENQIVEEVIDYNNFDHIFNQVRIFNGIIIALKITHRLRWKKRTAVLDHYKALDNKVGLDILKISDELQSRHRYFDGRNNDN